MTFAFDDEERALIEYFRKLMADGRTEKDSDEDIKQLSMEYVETLLDEALKK